MDDKQSQVDPTVAARQVELAGRGQVIASRWRDADLAVLGLPPEALALIAPRAGVDVVAALKVAVWLAGAVERAGISDAARTLWEISQGDTSLAEEGAHIWRQRESAARALARRVLDIETERLGGDA